MKPACIGRGLRRSSVPDELAQDGLDDRDLLSAVRDGDSDAFELLYHRHISAVRRVAQHMCDGPADAEDTVSEVFAAVLRLLHQGRGPTDNVRAYLNACVRNHVYTTARRRLREQLINLLPDDERLEAAPDVAQVAVLRFEKASVAKAFMTLSDRWQAALRLVDIENRKPSEVAHAFGVDANAMQQLVRRARRGLATAYWNTLEPET